MSNSVPSPTVGPACPPEIGASELKAVREFLTSFRDDAEGHPRPYPRSGERKTPAVSNGITRARFRSAAKPAG